MTCPQCSGDMILTRATAFGDEYHYCRVCRKELAELMVLEVPYAPTPGNQLEFTWPSFVLNEEDHKKYLAHKQRKYRFYSDGSVCSSKGHVPSNNPKQDTCHCGQTKLNVAGTPLPASTCTQDIHYRSTPTSRTCCCGNAMCGWGP